LFIEETTPELAIYPHHGFRTFRPHRYGLRGFLNRLMLHWWKSRGLAVATALLVVLCLLPVPAGADSLFSRNMRTHYIALAAVPNSTTWSCSDTSVKAQLIVLY